MIINIVSASPFNYQLLEKYPADFTIGVDYGAYRLIKNNYKIDIALGDFDSMSEKELMEIIAKGVKVNKYNAEKDKTDTEIALDYALTLNPQIINLFGVTGKRIDHFLSVLNLFKKVINLSIDMYIYDDFNKIYLRKPGNHIINKTDYKYISFFSYNELVKDLTLKNFRYELTNHLLNNNDSLCISNEITKDKGVVTFSSGILLIVESKD